MKTPNETQTIPKGFEAALDRWAASHRLTPEQRNRAWVKELRSHSVNGFYCQGEPYNWAAIKAGRVIATMGRSMFTQPKDITDLQVDDPSGEQISKPQFRK